MAAVLNDRVYDNGLTILDTESTHLYICSQQPTTFTEASSTYALGSKSSISVGSPTAGVTGRKVVLAAITDGNVSASGTATHFAITDNTNSRLLATQALNGGGQAVTSGNTFSLGTVDIAIPAPTA